MSLVEEGIRTFDPIAELVYKQTGAKMELDIYFFNSIVNAILKMPLFVAQMVGDLCTLDLVSQHLLKQDILPQKVNH